jgi:hypothetical protein
MYEYQYIDVEWGIGLTGYRLEAHQDIIDQQAGDGWRFVTLVPTKIAQGIQIHGDLVFERLVGRAASDHE